MSPTRWGAFHASAVCDSPSRPEYHEAVVVDPHVDSHEPVDDAGFEEVFGNRMGPREHLLEADHGRAGHAQADLHERPGRDDWPTSRAVVTVPRW